jgi:AraC family transcriptional regulator, regulatory protein of adaptative response / DNA-3-methyladenine glycosylase II
VLDDRALRSQLCAIPGIGKWTAEYVAMRALSDPDAFPAGDLHLRRRAGGLTERQLEQRSEAWRPWRAYATMLLWQGDAQQAAAAAPAREQRAARSKRMVRRRNQHPPSHG